MKKTIFEYKDYKTYLRALIREKPKNGWGVRSALASALSCQSAYLTRVIDGDAHLSFEQACEVNAFFAHTKEESRFFLLLVSYNRAGSHALKKEMLSQIDEFLEKRLILKDRLDVKKSLSRSDQAIYYSSWHYTAIHFILTIPGLTKKSIAEYLGISEKTVSEVLEFLESVGLAEAEGNTYKTGITRIHLESDSPMISKHHTNWRLKAMHAIDLRREKDLHYSSVVTMSEKDAYNIKSVMVKAIEEIRAIVKVSPEEKIFCYTLDFFDLTQHT